MLEIKMNKKYFYQSLSLLFVIISVFSFIFKMYILAAVFMLLFIRYFWYYDKNIYS